MKEKKLPNIVFIVMDSARRDQFGCYGNRNELTPYINKLAKESLVMNDHYAAGCGSAQAHVSMFLGQHSCRHGVVHNMSEMKEDVVALPRVLKKYGYKTYGHCMASFIPPAGYEDLFGFDEFYYPGKEGTTVKHGFKSRIQQILRKYPKLWTLLKKFYLRMYGKEALIKRSAKGFDGKKSLDYLSKKLVENTNTAPVFAYTTLLHPHTPYYPPQWCIDKVFKGQKIEKEAFDIQENMHAWVNGDLGAAERGIESLFKLYQAELIYADHLLENFVEDLRERGILENTILVVTSDHGELFGEHGQLNHGATVWEEIYRLPLIIRFPAEKNRVGIFEYLTSGLDIFPTIMDSIGKLDDIKNDTKLDGISVLRNNNKARYIVVDAPPLVLPERLKQYPKVIAKGSVFYRAVRDIEYKYIWQSNGRSYLYQVGKKENSDNNIAEEKKDIVEQMHNKLIQYYKSIDEELALDMYPINMGASAARKMTNPLIQKELKKLGYM